MTLSQHVVQGLSRGPLIPGSSPVPSCIGQGHNKIISPTKLDLAYYRHHLVLAMWDIFHFVSVKGFGRVLELQVSQGQFTL